MAVRIGTAFIPVSEPAVAAAWFETAVGLVTVEVNEWAAQLQSPGGRSTELTLLGPASGVTAPGLEFATCNFVVDDLGQTRDRLERLGAAPSEIAGTPEVCLFFTARDPDGNVLLLVDR